MIKPIHPFPARMAPELAIAELQTLPARSVVLDPMSGSGTVLRHAQDFGHCAIGFDMDPLAVLMAKVWTTSHSPQQLKGMMRRVMDLSLEQPAQSLPLWIENDEETRKFVSYWFAEPQVSVLSKIARAIHQIGSGRISASSRDALDFIRVVFSRLIITKDLGASLARDVSHSRPHKVCEKTDFDVYSAFQRSFKSVCQNIEKHPITNPLSTKVSLGDARSLARAQNRSVDAVLTSPPYLNAIDYMRGHRMSLIWFGYGISELRNIRSNSIGAERGPDSKCSEFLFETIVNSMGQLCELPRRHTSMILRYADDLYRMMSEVARVIKPDGRAILVVGNSCLKGTFIKNSDGVISAGKMVGLRLIKTAERELPERSRYLPISSLGGDSLSKRMRTETILTFQLA